MPQQNAYREQLQRERERDASFQHTQLGVYLAGAFGLMYLWASSAQGIVDKYHFSKRWFYLYGALCLFAYLYMRPFVRRGLGSAGRGYLNFGTMYICWLCSAVFCHLPSFEALGLDMKADVSLGLSIAASSLLVLGVMHGVQQLLIHFKFLAPAPGATQKAVWTSVLLNTLTLAMTCSTYFQLCGNGGAREGLQGSSFLHQAVCAHWLSPIPTQEYPNFSAWMLYGEPTTPGNAAHARRSAVPAPSSNAGSSSGIFNASFWGWGSPPPAPPPPEEPFLTAFNASQLAELVSPVSGPDSGGSVISPVFTMWITLVALYIVNVLADHVAASDMSARHISELRRDLVPDPDIALLAQLSTAAGITLRENAHQWAAAQQQRHAEARRSLGGRARTPGIERFGRANKKQSGIKRSKSLESHRPAKQPWSPRYTMERALVNILETTSSFSFKAAALLEGKPFTWQEGGGGNAAGLAGTASGAAGSAGLGVRHSSSKYRQQQQQPQQQQQQRGGRVGRWGKQGQNLSSTAEQPQSEAQQQQQQQHAGTGARPRAPLLHMHHEPSFKSQLPAAAAAAAAAAAGGSSGSSGGGSSGSSGRPQAIRHQRSRSLSSIHSGDAAPPYEQDEYTPAQQQQQQQNEEISMPSMPPVASPFAKVSQQGPGAFSDRAGTYFACGFGSAISLHTGTPPSSHRWKHQQQQQQQYAHQAAADAGSGTGQGVSSGGSPASATPSSAGGAGTAAAGLDEEAAAADAAVQPPFLDMVPWYSGTSADLFKTMFDLLISVKLFLGRFDMRTMQAATAASMAEHPSHSTPQEGDGFTFEQYADRSELWFDFIADTGDGGNPTYAVARALAAPELLIPCNTSSCSPQKGHNAGSGGVRQQQQGGGSRSSSSSSVSAGAQSSVACQDGQLELPRGEVLLLGGDLAYPNPSRETFEQRLFVPFQEALPPPPHYHPGRLVVHKPDLPPSFGPPAPPSRLGGLGPLPAGLSPRASRGASVAALREYSGPNAFAIPGNHDWIDGLETFIQQIQHKGWLGGWLLPQEKSYFALRLPAGWWVFGLDLALVGDIDMCQYRYFANLIEQRLGPNDNVIIITHEPTWLLEWFWASSSSSNLRQLVRGHLRGRARVHLAGDLHFYMRHSYSGSNRHGSSAGAARQQQNEASASAAATPLAEAALQQHRQQQQQQQQDAVAAMPVGGRGSNGRRVSSSSSSDDGHPEDDTTSSSSGVDSCGSGPEAAAEAVAAVHSRRHHQQQQQHSGSNSHIGGGSSSSSSQSQGGNCPVQKAQLRLPKLQLNRSSFEGLSSAAADGKPYSGTAVAAAAAAAAAAVAGPTAPYNGHLQAAMGAAAGTHHPPHHHYHHPQQQQQQYVGVSGSRSRLGGGGGPTPAEVAAVMQAQRQQQQHTFMDPEHLIVNGMGGAFMHPTHVFSYSRFAVLDDEAATATAAIYSSSGPHRNMNSSSVWNAESLSWHCPMSPSSSDLWEAGHSPLAPLFESGAAAAAAGPGLGSSYGGTAVGPPGAAAAAEQGANGSSGSAQQTVPVAGVGIEGSSSSGGGSGGGASGLYKCAALFPSAATSLKLGRNNLHLFRFKNSRFDVIGGAIYFLSIVSILPRCNAGLALLASTSLLDFAVVFSQEFMACWYSLFMESYLSLFMACAFFVLCLGFAKGGGVGAVSGERQEQQQAQAQRARSARSQQRAQRQGSTPSGAAAAAPAAAAAGAAGAAVKGSTSSSKQKRRSPVVGPLVKLRTGGTSNQLLVAMLHTGAHLSLAVVLLLMLELGVEICIKYESLGSDGMGSMYRWFEAYQDEHFPDPQGLRAMAHKWSLGLYPGIIKAAMAVYDIPEAIAVVRSAVCAAPSAAAGFASLSRLQVLAYYGGMLAYYWLLATPAMGFVFGLYLYISVCWFHVHYDEAFSALRIANFKGLSRLHITADGDLEIFTLGMDRVPTSWREDPRWYSPGGAGSGHVPAHAAAYPSRWIPAETAEGSGSYKSGSFSGDFEAAGLWDPRQLGRGADDEAAGAAATAAAVAAANTASMGLRLVDYVKVPRIRQQL